MKSSVTSIQVCELFGVHDEVHFVDLQDLQGHSTKIEIRVPGLPSYHDVTTCAQFPSVPYEFVFPKCEGQRRLHEFQDTSARPSSHRASLAHNCRRWRHQRLFPTNVKTKSCSVSWRLTYGDMSGRASVSERERVTWVIMIVIAAKVAAVRCPTRNAT